MLGSSDTAPKRLTYKNLLSGYRSAFRGSRLARRTGSSPHAVCVLRAASCEMARRLLVFAALAFAFAPPVCAAGRPGESASTLDRELQQRAQAPHGHSRVILRLTPGTDAESVIRGVRGTLGRRLVSVAGQVADVPDAALDALSRLPGVDGIS